MRGSNKLLWRVGLGYGAFCLVNYVVAKVTAGTVRTGAAQSLLGINDSLLHVNVLTYVLGTPTAPLAPGVNPVTLPGDTVTAPTLSGYQNVVPLRPPG